MRSEHTLVSIIIVGYNAGKHLSSCLDSIYNQTYKNFEVIFVNNGSNDNTSLILKSYPDLRIIKNINNTGFCFANNQGIRIARGGYILTLNSDVILDKRFLAEMGKSIETNRAALFGAKILDRDDKTIDSTGLVLSRFYRFFDRGNGEVDMGQYDKDLEIFGPCAAAALYKREMLEDIKYNGGYFDEDFFFLAEDFDLAWRAQKRNWKALFVPSAICYHAKERACFNDKVRQYLSFRNRFFLLIKNGKITFRYLAIFFLYDIPRLLYMTFTNRYTFRALREVVEYINVNET